MINPFVNGLWLVICNNVCVCVCACFVCIVLVSDSYLGIQYNNPTGVRTIKQCYDVDSGMGECVPPCDLSIQMYLRVGGHSTESGNRGCDWNSVTLHVVIKRSSVQTLSNSMTRLEEFQIPLFFLGRTTSSRNTLHDESFHRTCCYWIIWLLDCVQTSPTWYARKMDHNYSMLLEIQIQHHWFSCTINYT